MKQHLFTLYGQSKSINEAICGNPDGFLSFAKENRGWKVLNDRAENQIIIDEGKNYCACPLVKGTDGAASSVLRNCSSIYMEMLFSYILQRTVTANVRRSFLRDGQSCIYEIMLG